LAKLLEVSHPQMKMALLGHKARYKAWQGTAADFNAFKTPKSMSAELMSLASVVSTCEAVVSRGNADMVASANSEVRKQYRPTRIKQGEPEQFARMLVTMEKFIHSTVPEDPEDPVLENPPVTIAELEECIKLNSELLHTYDADMRLDVSKLLTAVDVCRKIINQSQPDMEGEDYFAQNDPPDFIQDQLIAAVYDAWGNIAKLQTEAQANEMTMTLVQTMGALKGEQMSFDEFATNVGNFRLTLNKLLEEDKDNHNEISLLSAISKLTNVNDPDAINIAARETKTQLTNLQITELVTDALKNLFDAFHLYLDDKDSAIPLLRQHVQNFSNYVVKLGAVEDDPFVLRTALIMAVRCTLIDMEKIEHHGQEHEMRHEIPTDDEIQSLLDNIIGPWVHGHNSAPKSAELKQLIEMVQRIVDEQLNARTVKEVTASAQNIKGSRTKVVEEMGKHRRRLAYRQRMQVKKDANEVIELRAAQKTGAEWDGFRVENVNLKKVEKETKTKLQQAFEAFDIDKSGSITIDEGMEFLKSCPPAERPKGLKDVNLFMRKQVKARLAKVDTDGDGQITFDEFKKWWIDNDNEE